MSSRRRRFINSADDIYETLTWEEQRYFGDILTLADEVLAHWLKSFMPSFESVEDFYGDNFYYRFDADWYELDPERAVRDLVGDLTDTQSAVGERLFDEYLGEVRNIVDTMLLNLSQEARDGIESYDDLEDAWGGGLDPFVEKRFRKLRMPEDAAADVLELAYSDNLIG